MMQMPLPTSSCLPASTCMCLQVNHSTALAASLSMNTCDDENGALRQLNQEGVGVLGPGLKKNGECQLRGKAEVAAAHDLVGGVVVSGICNRASGIG